MAITPYGLNPAPGIEPWPAVSPRAVFHSTFTTRRSERLSLLHAEYVYVFKDRMMNASIDRFY